MMAVRAYKQSNMSSLGSKKVPPEALNRIIEHLVCTCYTCDPKFSLHLNLVFIAVVMTKLNSSILSMNKYLGHLVKSRIPHQ